MVTVLSLWLPILLSAVLVFIASSLIHMLLRYHSTDYGPVPGEEGVATAIRAAAVPPGDYALPYAGSMQAMSSPEFREKMERGPVALITVRPTGQTNMGKLLLQWFVFSLVVGIFAAYVTSRAIPPGASYGDAFRFAGTTAFVGYGLGTWSESIWFGRKWSTSVKNTIDALIYGLVTGGVFGWLWPGS